MIPEALKKAINTLPAGKYAVGVSGGADSTALLCLLSTRQDLQLVTVHLNHQLRSSESDGDEAFVTELSGKLRFPCVIADRTTLEADQPNLPANPSARYRQLRLGLFQQVVERYQLDGVTLAHHADDQAETVLLRLLRGHTELSLGGITTPQHMPGITIHRPLLSVYRQSLRDYLTSINQPWRDDTSNQSDDYRRNIVRKMLAYIPTLTTDILNLSDQCKQYKQYLAGHAPQLPKQFNIQQLDEIPVPLVLYALRQWLITQGASADDISYDVCQRLYNQTQDAAQPSKQDYPGALHIQRQKGQIRCL